MASGDVNFIKSVLRTQELVGETEDTSLAVPQEEQIAVSQNHTNDRSSRVQRQVQLTLARKGKRATSNGSLHLSRNQSADGTSAQSSLSGHLYKMKHYSTGQVNGDTWGRDYSTDRLTSRDGMRKPTMRVEVSPPPSPVNIRARYRTLRYGGVCTLPTRTPTSAHSSRVERTQSTGLSHRYARSETLQSKRLQAYSCGAFLGGSPPQPQPPTHVDDAVFLSSGPPAFQYREPLPGYQQLGLGQPPEGYAQFRHLRRESRLQQSPRQASYPASYPASLVSVELDGGRRMAVAATATAGVRAQQPAREGSVRGKSQGQGTDLTLEKAVAMLSHENTDLQITAAQYIQHQCFTSSDAKRMMYYLHGIPKLISLFQSDSEQLQTAAAGALRNVVFESNENKMEVKDNDGIPAALQLLKSSRDIETRKQLTGLLWNLSSHDLLKDYLSREATHVLTKSVLIPCSGLCEGDNPKDDLLAHPDIFYNATGCLRNMSSAGPEGRKTMRECDSLIDSLVHYIRGTIADRNPDDKSTENCVCILHNLSYQMETEVPQKYFAEMSDTQQNLVTKPKTPGCFGVRSARVLQQSETERPLLEEKSNPRGMEWLWSPITIRMYLSLMACSSRRYSQEAALGALQNVTAGNGAVSRTMAHTIVQREGGLQKVKKMLEEGEPDVKRAAVSLLRNISRYPELQADIVKQVLPELISMLSGSNTDMPAEVTISLFHILLNISQNEAQNALAIVNNGGLGKIVSISAKDYGSVPSRESQVASILLHAMWKHRDLHGAYRKAGYKKAAFINQRTVRAVSSARN
ncbi:hypothetical protein MATL_G00245970 [Megalops atlanticus]|uniref:Plakophilin 2 n=1 Tax=Megalops atlanticus TaxID=7932 RepID=A0A9D3T0D9_MEGAT|nr:hypothetical protein MATL_G00245970 [Megalops atlanticus]